jgi:hypothetical protein
MGNHSNVPGPEVAQIVDLTALEQRGDALTVSVAHRDVQEQVTVPERLVVDRRGLAHVTIYAAPRWTEFAARLNASGAS